VRRVTDVFSIDTIVHEFEMLKLYNQSISILSSSESSFIEGGEVRMV